MEDQDHLKQATADFELFLSGKRAPALVGHSLLSIVSMPMDRIVRSVMNWTFRQRNQHIVEALMNARNKVFDIFFYRITRFDRIYSFFPEFESALVAACPNAEQARLDSMFQQYKWQDIRPIGTIRDQFKFIIEKRKEIAVQTEKFNENIYKNATFSVLSADRQYAFSDPKMGEQIAGYQAKVEAVFSDFIDQLKDKKTKREILLANESDRYNVYQTKENFNIELYLMQLVDLGIALFNDDFLYQSAQIFSLIRDLAGQHKVKIGDLKKLQDKGELFNTQKLEDYSATRSGCLMIKRIISLFSIWQPQLMLNKLQMEESRRVRRLLLKALECYGREIYGLLVAELNPRAHTAWYYTRNLAYLLGRVTSDNDILKQQAAEMLNNHWQPQSNRALVREIISTLGFIGTDQACNILLSRLRMFEPQREKDSYAEELCNKIAIALAGTESDRALETTIDFCQRNDLLPQIAEKFSKLYLSDPLVQNIVGRVRREMQRFRFTFSLLGDTSLGVQLLRLVAHMGTEPVQTLCRNITKSLSRKNPLFVEAERTLQQAAPLPFYSKDPAIQKLAMTKNIPEIVCHISETRLSGKLYVRTTGEAVCEIDFDRGEALHAKVNAYYIEREDAFYWSFLLDTRDIESIYFHHAQSAPITAPSIVRPIEQIISEGLSQRGRVIQLATSHLSAESRFRQRSVSSFYTSFQRTRDPEKYTLVWEALAADRDIAALQEITRLSKYDLYGILVHLLKENMLVVDDEEERHKLANIEDGLAMLDMNLKRIERRPVMFNYYNSSAEICADLMRISDDEVLRFGSGVLRNYFLEHYEKHKVFGQTNAEICRQVIMFLARYLSSSADENRQELLDYISFTFNVEDVSLRPEALESQPIIKSELEKLENIELGNDPLDFITGDFDPSMLDDSLIDDMVGSLDAALGTASPDAAGDGKRARKDSGLTAAEESMIRELFDNIALAYVKPLKDFVRELYRNWEAGRETSIEWIEIVDPIFMLLYSSSGKMGYRQVADAVMPMQKIVLEQKSREKREGITGFDEESSQALISAYLKLCELQPKTFALVVSDEGLTERKEVLVVKFILKQAAEMNEKLLGKILFAGLNTFDKFMQSNPGEIAALTGIPKPLAEEIFMKFYQYRNIYYRHDSPEYYEKFLSMFELNLRLLKEIHMDFENAAMEEQREKEIEAARKEKLKLERQRTLWSLFILLCIKEEFDLVETIQQSVFDMRIQLLEEYLAKTASSQNFHQAQMN